MSGLVNSTSKKLNNNNSSKKLSKDILKRKVSDMKPWKPKDAWKNKNASERKLGTRLRGEIYRRPDRPYSQIDLSEDTFDHYDKFEINLDNQTNYVTNRLKSANYTWNITSTNNSSLVTPSIIPGNKPLHRPSTQRIKPSNKSWSTDKKGQENHKKNKVTKRKVKPKKMFMQSYIQAQRMCLALATKKVDKK